VSSGRFSYSHPFGRPANDSRVPRGVKWAGSARKAHETALPGLHERARELFAEEPRHSELVRISYIMAKAGLNGYSLTNFSEKNYYFDRVMRYNNTYEKKIQLLGNTANMAPFHVLWPIPSLVITANTKGVINQNIGYDGANRNVPPLTKIE